MTVKDSEERFFTSFGQFEFHHKEPAEKASDYDNLIRQRLSGRQLDELDKCVLLCVRCHRVAERQGYRGTVRFRVEFSNGKVRTQRMAVRMLYDANSRHMLMYSTDRYLLKAYEYRLGRSKPVHCIARELERRILRLILATKRRRLLEIMDEEGLVMSASRIDSDHVALINAYRFDLHTAEYATHDPANQKVWVRNGARIDRLRGVTRQGYWKVTCAYDEFPVRSARL